MERTTGLRDRFQRVTSFTVCNEKTPRGPEAAQMGADAVRAAPPGRGVGAQLDAGAR